MLPRCRTVGEPFVIPTFDVQVSDVEADLHLGNFFVSHCE
jgi:hypothetical protein